MICWYATLMQAARTTARGLGLTVALMAWPTTSVQAATHPTEPAAIFVTWDGDPTTSVSIDWHMERDADLPTLEIRARGVTAWAAHRGISFPFPHSTRTVRRARITGLLPGAEYELRIGRSRIYRYRTMPATLTRAIRFATGGDTQAGDATFGATNRMVAAQDVDFVLLGGDLAYSNGDPRLVKREEEWFETVTKTLVTKDGRLIPVIAAIGNHEVFSARDTAAAFQQMIQQTGVKFGEATYYQRLHAHARDRQYGIVDVGNYLSLVLLNTAHTAAIGGEQTEWLRGELAKRTSVPHIFPVYHVPGYPSVRSFDASNSAQVREHWAPLFEDAGVRVAFENHDHAYKRTPPVRAGQRDTSGVVYIGDGAWGAGPRPIARDHKQPVWYLEKTSSVNHAIIVTVVQGNARLEVRDSTGAMVDSLRVLRRASGTRRTAAGTNVADTSRRWLAGDHHIHSEFSADYTDAPAGSTEAPTPVLGADGRYPIAQNATMARQFGLHWMVSTDHGGPNHSKLNHDQAYPKLLQSRRDVPQVIQFYGMEFDTPGADHSSMIIPTSEVERTTLREIESTFSKRDAFPRDGARDTEPKMLEALRYMRDVATPPVVIANHPSRSATDVGKYGQDRPAELRDWNDAAPRVAIGMEGAPGHQASAINKDGSLDPAGARGGYGNSPTLGGFDQMTARVGGFWDAMLGEGRRWWITSTSDSHANWRDGGSDFWPGEYSKTYVHARPTPDDLLAGLRGGRIFVTTGDLISELDVTVSAAGQTAEIGGELTFPAGANVQVSIRVRDPKGGNHHGDSIAVQRVDLIVGDVTGPAADRNMDANPSTQVVQRFTPSEWRRTGEILTMTYTLRNVRSGSYVRVRGTNSAELEPAADPRGENPWSDLWFYANPIFLVVR